MQADKVFVVAANIDESIKRFCPSYSIQIFPDFPSLEEYVDTTPDIVYAIIVTEDVLQFTGSNMARLRAVVENPFITLTSRCIYLYSMGTSTERVKAWNDQNPDFLVSTYQGNINDQFIIGIINGKLRDSDEQRIEEVTYRYRASEYAQDQKIKRYESDNSAKYETDDDEMSGVQSVDEPAEYTPMGNVTMEEFPIVGVPGHARTCLAFIEAQYLALSSRTLIIESDVRYHRLTDMVLKSDVECLFIDVSELFSNVNLTLDKIKSSKDNLIVVGSVTDIKYDYTYLRSLLGDVLKEFIQNFVVECDFADTPYNGYYTVVFDDTLPDLLRCTDSLLYPVNNMNTVFIGVRQNTLQPYNLSTSEIVDIICEVLSIDEVYAQTVTLNGSTIKKEDSVYDLFSIIGRGNRR